MQKPELEKIVKKYCRHIQQHTEEAPGNFYVEGIHDLRVEYKKLRAFIRLLQQDDERGVKLQVPLKLTEIYRSAAAIRDLQLFIPHLQETLQDKKMQGAVYITFLQRNLFNAKENFVQVATHDSFRQMRASIIACLPAELSNHIIEKFLQLKVSAINLILLAIKNDDDDLHTIRKHLKDIVYNIKIFTTEWGIPFPVVAWKNEKRLLEIADALGNYNDLCIALSFLNNSIIYPLPQNEKKYLNGIRDEWFQKKEEMKCLLIPKIKSLNLKVVSA